MSATISNSRLEKLGRRSMYIGFAAFTTTGTTKKIAVPFKYIESVSLTYTGTPALADGQLSLSSTAGVASDILKRDSDGTVTVNRVAGSTTGQGFAFVLFGH